MTELQFKRLPKSNGTNIDYLRAVGCEQQLGKFIVVLSFHLHSQFSCQVAHLENNIGNFAAFQDGVEASFSLEDFIAKQIQGFCTERAEIVDRFGVIQVREDILPVYVFLVHIRDPWVLLSNSELIDSANVIPYSGSILDGSDSLIDAGFFDLEVRAGCQITGKFLVFCTIIHREDKESAEVSLSDDSGHFSDAPVASAHYLLEVISCIERPKHSINHVVSLLGAIVGEVQSSTEQLLNENHDYLTLIGFYFFGSGNSDKQFLIGLGAKAQFPEHSFNVGCLFDVDLDGLVVEVGRILGKDISDLLGEGCRGANGEVFVDAIGEHDVQWSALVFSNVSSNYTLCKVIWIHQVSRKDVIRIKVHLSNPIVSLLEYIDVGQASLFLFISGVELDSFFRRPFFTGCYYPGVSDAADIFSGS